ncbi:MULTISPECIES: helix-turn-helix domain-containing protein [Pseudomonas syringae group]|uniref:helix-turn-helix domain-containing protein n=1 Tax=Pseudomonas syringae group TaxID=136849 RepID=UPI0003FA965D|nr:MULTISPECIES: helix-turn-helix domain-containing protein [Pseudomonas syringae group]PBP48706.1 DNA-binding protein [Pseudomonas syringae]
MTSSVEEEIAARLATAGVTPLIGGLVPEPATAELLGYAPSYLRRLAAEGHAPIPFVRRGNRRFYKVADIVRFATNTAA